LYYISYIVANCFIEYNIQYSDSNQASINTAGALCKALHMPPSIQNSALPLPSQPVL